MADEGKLREVVHGILAEKSEITPRQVRRKAESLLSLEENSLEEQKELVQKIIQEVVETTASQESVKGHSKPGASKKRKAEKDDSEEDEDEQDSSNFKQSKNDDGETCFSIGSDLLRVTLKTFKNHKLIDIRKFYKDKKTNKVMPSIKGISLNPEQWKGLTNMAKDIDAQLLKMGR